MNLEHCISLEYPSEWKASLEGINHTIAHTWEYCYAMYLTTRFPTYLYTIEIGNVRIVCPINERTFDGYTDIVTPYGFSGFVSNGPCSEFQSYWNEFVKKKVYVCGYIGLNPFFNCDDYYFPDEVYQYNDVYVMDLKLTDEELFENLPKSKKNELRHLESSLPGITFEKSIGKDFFLSYYNDFIKRMNTSHTYEFSEETLSFLIDLDDIFIVAMQSSGRVEAVSIFAYTHDVGDYMFNVSLPEGRKFSALLIWHGAKHLKSLGIPLLNLGGGIRKDDGVAKFKKRFGAKEYPLKCLKQVYDTNIYEKLCWQTNSDFNDKSGYFPPYRNR